MGSDLGISDDKLIAVAAYESSDLFTQIEKVTLEYADAMTSSDRDVDDELFSRVREHYSEEAVVELTAVIAWENASTRFNRALRVESQDLWSREVD